ncbi:MAG: phosphopyruvate hydratase [Enterococcus italicus]|uniref:phosphopyruvate hydratase n=1 Tax=Enterococcus italicus TaxID=246144 RepID=UPI0039958F32
MTLYQKMQLSPAVLRQHIRECFAQEKKQYVTALVLRSVLLLLFAIAYISIFTSLFGQKNSYVGVGSLCMLLSIRFVNYGYHIIDSLVALFFISSLYLINSFFLAGLPVILYFVVQLASLSFILLMTTTHPEYGNGGVHADSGIDVQEFLITPVKRNSFRDGVEKVANIYHTLKSVLGKEGYETAVGDEGGFAPKLGSTEAAIEMLYRAIKEAGYVPGEEIAIALDPASSEFYSDETKKYHFEGKEMTSNEMLAYYQELVKKYPAIISIEDGFSEHDWDGFKKMTEEMGDIIQLVGDDIFVTNPTIFAEGIKKQVANSILIKLNQIGTVSESIETIKMARSNGYTTMISHRSGETGDTFIADFAVAMNAGQIKTGSMARSERVEKYNQFLRIEEELAGYGQLAHFPKAYAKENDNHLNNW